MGFLWLRVKALADGVGVAPTQPGGSLGYSGPGHYCSANHPKWSGWQELHLRPPRSKRGRLLLTLHPEKLALTEGLPPSASMLEASRSAD